MPAKEAPFLRFMKSYEIDPDTGCWEWKLSKYRNGYGWLKVFGKVVSAHRFSHELYKGPIPDGMQILHSCDNRGCVNPDHLRAGTHQENMQDAVDRGRMRSGESHPLSMPVRVLGVEYESQISAERALGLGSGTVSYWLKNHPNKARYIKD